MKRLTFILVLLVFSVNLGAQGNDNYNWYWDKTEILPVGLGIYRTCSGQLKVQQSGWSVLKDEACDKTVASYPIEATDDSTSGYITVTRRWKDLEPNIYYGKVPTAKEISKWEKDFEAVNPPDTVWSFVVGQYKNTEHYVAIRDYIELLHGSQSTNYPDDDRRLLWRLDQYDPLVEQKPHTGAGKVLYIRNQYERLLDYELGSQWDMTLWAWLSTDFRELYGRVLEKEIMSRIGLRVFNELRKEFKAEGRYYEASSKAFQIIEGSPIWSGSSFPYRTGFFGSANIDIGNIAKESLFKALVDSTYSVGNMYAEISKAILEQEYTRFDNALSEYEDYTYPLDEQRSALDGDKKAFFFWMSARYAVSEKLTGTVKRNYDNATQAIMRQKLILLKNRFNLDDGFCPEYIVKQLLANDCSDNELKNHYLEKQL